MQPKFFPVILFLHVFSTGVVIPVFSLIFLAKGLALGELAIVMGAMSFTVIVLELPTGILADLCGRKRIFLFSVLFSSIGVIIILFNNSLALLCLGMVATGAGRALSSGSLESLYIDGYVSEYGNEALPVVLTRLNVLEPAGLAIGAALGGFLPGISIQASLLSPYDSNLVVKLLAGIATGLLAMVLIREPHGKKTDNDKEMLPSTSQKSPFRLQLKSHLQESLELVRSQPVLSLIFVSVFTAGFFLFTLETYWQPQFIDRLTDPRSIWLLGLLSFSYFAAALLGSLLAKELLKRTKIRSHYLFPLGRLALASFLILLGYQLHLAGFILIFVLIFFSLGLSNIPESVLLNSAVPNQYRASALSMSSLILQLGGLIGSVICVILLQYITVPLLWSIASILMMISSIGFLLFQSHLKK